MDDGAYGYKNKETGEWNGLMGELLSQVKIGLFQSCNEVSSTLFWEVAVKNLS